MLAMVWCSPSLIHYHLLLSSSISRRTTPGCSPPLVLAVEDPGSVGLVLLDNATLLRPGYADGEQCPRPTRSLHCTSMFLSGPVVGLTQCIVLPITLYIKAHTTSTVDICARMCGGDGLVVPTLYCDKGQGHTSRFSEKKPGARGYIRPVLAYHKPRWQNMSNKNFF